MNNPDFSEDFINLMIKCEDDIDDINGILLKSYIRGETDISDKLDKEYIDALIMNLIEKRKNDVMNLIDHYIKSVFIYFIGENKEYSMKTNIGTLYYQLLFTVTDEYYEEVIGSSYIEEEWDHCNNCLSDYSKMRIDKPKNISLGDFKDILEEIQNNYVYKKDIEYGNL